MREALEKIKVLVPDLDQKEFAEQKSWYLLVQKIIEAEDSDKAEGLQCGWVMFKTHNFEMVEKREAICKAFLPNKVEIVSAFEVWGGPDIVGGA